MSYNKFIDEEYTTVKISGIDWAEEEKVFFDLDSNYKGRVSISVTNGGHIELAVDDLLAAVRLVEEADSGYRG